MKKFVYEEDYMGLVKTLRSL